MPRKKQRQQSVINSGDTLRHGDVIVTSQGAPDLRRARRQPAAVGQRRRQRDRQTDGRKDGRTVSDSVGYDRKLNLDNGQTVVRSKTTDRDPRMLPLPSEIGRQDAMPGLLNIPCRQDDCSPSGHRTSSRSGRRAGRSKLFMSTRHGHTRRQTDNR